jgi:hypothetical protein
MLSNRHTNVFSAPVRIAVVVSIIVVVIIIIIPGLSGGGVV